MIKKHSSSGIAIAILLALVGVPVVHAATTATSQLTQTISAGTLSTSIRDGSNVELSTPGFGMSSVNVKTTAQQSTGTFGTSDKRIYVDNPGAVTGTNTWTLSLNATTPGTGTWMKAGAPATAAYLYNGTSTTGLLTVNASAGTYTPVSGTSTGITARY